MLLLLLPIPLLPRNYKVQVAKFQCNNDSTIFSVLFCVRAPFASDRQHLFGPNYFGMVAISLSSHVSRLSETCHQFYQLEDLATAYTFDQAPRAACVSIPRDRGRVNAPYFEACPEPYTSQTRGQYIYRVPGKIVSVACNAGFKLKRKKLSRDPVPFSDHFFLPEFWRKGRDFSASPLHGST